MKKEQLEKSLEAAQQGGLGITSLRALLHLGGFTAPKLGAKLGELAAASGVSCAAMTGHADRLEKAGYATRENAKSDRRSVYLCITPKGQALLNITLNA